MLSAFYLIVHFLTIKIRLEKILLRATNRKQLAILFSLVTILIETQASEIGQTRNVEYLIDLYYIKN